MDVFRKAFGMISGGHNPGSDSSLLYSSPSESVDPNADAEAAAEGAVVTSAFASSFVAAKRAPSARQQGVEMGNLQDYHRRMLSARYELSRKVFKAFCKDPNLPGDMREKLRYKLSKLPRNSSFTRVRNRCIFTGRPRAVYEVFRMSRIVFRELASRGSLTGVKKASW